MKLKTLSVLILSALTIGGCTNINLFEKKINFVIYADENVNGGGVLHMLVQPVSKQEFAAQSYDEMHDVLVTDKGLVHQKIMPQTVTKFSIKAADLKKEAIGVYFFFKGSQSRWKVLVPLVASQNSQRVEIEVLGSQLVVRQ